MIKLLDDFLNTITMYRLVLYYLTMLLIVAVVLSFWGLLPFSLISLVISASFITLVSWITNWAFSKVFKVQTNVESVYISAFILTLLITPAGNLNHLWFLGWAAVLAMASKYIFAIYKKHIFNPAALAVSLTAVVLNQSASWWVGTSIMLPFVLIGGLLLVRKIQRFSLVLSFLILSFISIAGFSLLKGNDLFLSLQQVLLDSPTLFFALVMLTEPLTTPPTKKLQIIYGGLVGLLFAPYIHIGSLYSTPELSLIAGNIFSYVVSPKKRLLLRLKEKRQVALDTFEFIFSKDQTFDFLSGQYLEWTLAHKNPDSRGNRRYFTLDSSPTEPDISIGVKFYPQGSSFKKALFNMEPNSQIMAGQLSGGFTLPKDPSKKLVFIAGGIGVTPFRSMVKSLLDLNQKRDIVLFYSNKTREDIAYRDIFDQAFKLGLKTVYILTDQNKIPKNWNGKVGFLDGELIAREVPDFKDRMFYISGPHSMVDAFEQTLQKLVPQNQIKTDFFPGYA